MSRIGKQPVTVPNGVEAKVKEHTIFISGPKGKLELVLLSEVIAEIKNNEILVSVNNPQIKKQLALWGLFRNLIKNMIVGVTEGFHKDLEINGIGFKAAVAGDKLSMNIGFSHPVDFRIPKDIEIKVTKNIITITGIDKQLVGQVAARIRSLKPVEPYKGKGLRYVGEYVKLKPGKAAAKTE